MMAMLAILISGRSDAATSSRGVRVGATVVSFLVDQMDGLPETIAVTDADIAAGYIDVRAVRLTIRTNDPVGYTIAFQVSPEISRVTVSGLDEKLEFGAGGAFITRRLERIFPIVYEMSFRLYLSKTATIASRALLRVRVLRLSV